MKTQSPPSATAIQAKRWLRDQLTVEAMRSLEDAWATFDRTDRPVITLLGGYDTGKSAMLRRLLVDDGQPCPAWLTISARHETFEANQADVLGCTIRDTPGLVLETGSDRAEAHNSATEAASELTDALLLVFPPQGATAERGRIRDVIARGWSPGALSCTLNRFDEAGIDAADDPEGFAGLGSRKADELRTSLGLRPDIQVFITSPDPYQQNGAIAQPDPSSWDEFRSWDGIAGLVEWIKGTSARGPELRQEASDRYWRGALAEATADIAEAIDTQRTRAAEAAAAALRLGLFDDRLNALDRAARAALLAAVEEVALSGDRRGTVDDAWLGEALQAACDTWWDTYAQQLDDLNGELMLEFAAQSRRPVLNQLGFPGQDETPIRGPIDRTKAEQYADIGLRAWRVLVEEQRAVATRTRRPGRAARPKGPSSRWSDGRALAAAETLKPIVFELMDLINEGAVDSQRAKQAQQRRQELRDRIAKASRDSAETFRTEWDALVKEQRQAATDSWSPLGDQAAEAKECLALWEARHSQALEMLAVWPNPAGTSVHSHAGRRES